MGLGQNLAPELSQFNPAVVLSVFSTMYPKPCEPSPSSEFRYFIVFQEPGLLRPVASAKARTVPKRVYKVNSDIHVQGQPNPGAVLT